MAELKLLLERRYKKDSYSIGLLYVNGVLFSNTLEDKDRDLTFNMPLYEINRKKVYGETAIPRGVYRIEMTYSPKFAKRAWCAKEKGYSPQIMNVPGFGGIRIHPFNKPEESLGCIGVGDNKAKGMILNSTARYRELLEKHLLPAFARGDTVALQII